MAPQAADAGAGDELAVVQLDPLEVVAGNLGKKDHVFLCQSVI